MKPLTKCYTLGEAYEFLYFKVHWIHTYTHNFVSFLNCIDRDKLAQDYIVTDDKNGRYFILRPHYKSYNIISYFLVYEIEGAYPDQ